MADEKKSLPRNDTIFIYAALKHLVSKISPSTCYGLASNAYLNHKTERHM